MADLLTQDEIEKSLADVPGWSQEGNTITRSVEASSFMDGIRLVSSVAEAAEEMNHHPDIDIRWTTITFSLSTHYLGGLTSNDFQLASEIDRLAG
jgi:4a-hydroxytetrahydrobiopterin dehydratase